MNRLGQNNTHFRITDGFVIILCLLFVSCIQEFTPDLADTEDLMVINGSIIKGDTLQQVMVSRSVGLTDPLFVGISGCQVCVVDAEENTFSYYETETNGIYKASIPQQYLEEGSIFQLYVLSPDNQEYISSWETILESSPIDSLYYIIEQDPSYTEKFSDGIQFYTDLLAPDQNTKNYLWQVTETWEHHTRFKIDGYFPRGSLKIPGYRPVSDSIDVCWSTRDINEYYTASTENLVVNEKKRVPLNFISQHDEKQNIKYSINVRQYALNNGAYDFLSNNNLTDKGLGMLYQQQPVQSVTNIHNTQNMEERVLGYFWASSFTEKRIFFTGPLHYDVNDCELYKCYPPDCRLLGALQSRQKDLFLVAVEMANDSTVAIWGWPDNQLCINCTVEGGTTEKPVFWED